MKLYLIRHTKVNLPAGICYGKTDVGLANTFEEEKNLIIQKLTGLKFDKLYSSPLKRCALLAKFIANQHLKVCYDKRLMELNFGDWEGKTWNDIEKTDYAKKWFDNFTDVPCPEGESYKNLINRAKDFLDDLRKDKTINNIAIICHSGIIRAFYSILNQVEPKESFNLKLDYGQIIEIELN